MINFAGKVALVTGGTSGIGRATAIAYAQQQAKVVVAGRRIDEGEETVRLIKEAGGEAIFVQTDVSKEADVRAMVDRVISVFGRNAELGENSTKSDLLCQERLYDL